MHDQKFEKNFRPRPEDGLYGSNEPKKCEIRPVVSSIVHFKVFKSYFIYIIDRKEARIITKRARELCFDFPFGRRGLRDSWFELFREIIALAHF